MKLLIITLFSIYSLMSFAQTPSIVYPKNGQVLEDTAITLRWDANPEATSYQITLATDSLFQNKILDSSTTLFTFYFSLFTSNTYFWFIKYNSPSTSFNSSVFKFTVFSPLEEDSIKLWFRADKNIRLTNDGKVISWKSYCSNDSVWQPIDSLRPNFKDDSFYPSLEFLNNKHLFGQIQSQNIRNYNSSFFLITKPNTVEYLIPIAFNKPLKNSYTCLEVEIRLNTYAIWKGNASAYSAFRGYTNITNTSSFSFTINENDSIWAFKNIGFLLKGKVNFKTENLSQLAIGARIAANAANTRTNFYKGIITEFILINNFIAPNRRMLIEQSILHRLTPPLNLGPNILRRYGFCDTVLSTEKMYESYLWSTGDTTRSISVGAQDTGWYWCQVPNLYGQIMRDSVYVYNFIPKQDIQDTTICLGDSITLNSVLSSGYSYLWTDKQTSDTLSTSSTLSMNLSSNRLLALTVFDTLGCIITDSFRIFIDSFPIQASLGSDISLCTGDKIGLVSGNSEADSIFWNTGNADSLLVINSAGQYSIKAINTRGCVARDTIVVDIHGVTPYVAFSTLPVCLGDSTVFIDSSMSLDSSALLHWAWDFGNGTTFDTNAAAAPRMLYDSSGLFTTKLSVSTDSGCTNYAYSQVLVRPLPKPNFSPLTACQNLDVSFQNLTTHSDSILSNRWIFGQYDTAYTSSINATPIRQFAIYGNIICELKAMDIYGCSDSIGKNFFVRPSPTANFEYTPVCDGTPVYFNDNSTTEAFNPIQKWEWNIPYSTNSQFSQAASQLFPSAGFYSVSLKVAALNACWDTVTIPIKVHAFPMANFGATTFCKGAKGIFIDSSTLVLDTINFYQWSSDGTPFSLKKNPSVIFNDTNSHNISLFVKTSAACADEISKNIKVHNLPKPNFITDKEYGLPPLEVQFTNLSTSNTSAITSTWFFGDGVQSNIFSPKHIYQDSAVFYPQLIVSDSVGCSDSMSKVVYVVYAAIDVAVVDVVAQINASTIGYSCTIANFGKQNIKDLTLIARNNSGTEISENWHGNLLSGNSINFNFTSRVKISDNEPIKYFCVAANLVESSPQKDEKISNNSMCKDVENQFWIGNPYPNPANDKVFLDIVMPFAQTIELAITDINGRKIKTLAFNGIKGLNQISMPVFELQQGSYSISIQSMDFLEVRKFIK